MSQDCTLCFRPDATQTRGRNNALISSVHTIERYALNKKGVVGSLYDAQTDNLLTTSSTDTHLLVHKDVKENPICKLIKVDNSNCNSLLQLIGIQDDLRVSIALDMTQVTEGTLMLNAYELPADRPVRLIDYYHDDQEECLSNDIQLVRKTLPDLPPNNGATHIITSVRRGIDFVIVLELPENTNHIEIDSALKNLCEYFTKPKAAFLSREDQEKINLLQQIIFTSITEIHSFAENKDLSDICQYIHRYIYQTRDNFPLSYTLHPVKCIYCENLFNEKTFYQLDSWTVRTIEDKLLPFSNRFTRIERLFHNKVSPKLSQDAKALIEQKHKDMWRVKNVYTKVQQAVAIKVDERRRGHCDMNSFDNALNDTQLRILDSDLKTLQTTILELQTKGSSITNLKTDPQKEYLNVADSEGTNNHQENPEDTIETSQPSISLQTTRSVIKPNEINILLIGETGVGKSTFINAFVNYLAFHSLEQARIKEPIVLIPVSFVITSGDQFDETEIQFGQCDLNENHNHSGQSVTQHCKSYIFNIGNNIKLRIIDTPGIGDTRSAEQDNKNIEHILSYTSNLPHLNGICFLLKPNTTRLHALFRSCFTQLFNFLGPNACDNIIFCFTNTRMTFYTPGDTAKLLRKMLNELPSDHIPSFVKENTFCFDSESFRYLAILKAGHTVAFDDKEKLDFEKSWKISVAESIRLLNFIESRQKYEMNEWHSIKHAQMVIILLVRPILETIRNALRNLILRDIGNNEHTIELKAQPISLPACSSATCSHESTPIGNISIVTYFGHNYRTSNKCATCQCILDKHLSVLYELKYHLGGTKGSRFYSVIENMKNRLLYGSVVMTQFLLSIAHISENPFSPWFDLLVQEEQQLSQEKELSVFHGKLYNNIRDLKNEYEKRLNENQFDQDHITLDAIYGCIEEVLAYSPIIEQMNAAKASQMEMMKSYEHDVSSQYPRIDMTELLRRSTATTNK